MDPAREHSRYHPLGALSGHALCRAHDPRLVARLHVDLQRTSSAVCRATR